MTQPVSPPGFLRISGGPLRGYVAQLFVDGNVGAKSRVNIDLTNIRTQEIIESVADLSTGAMISECTAESIGRWLYDDVLNGLLRHGAHRLTRIGFHILPRELDYVPWELLHDGNQFLVLMDTGDIWRHPGFDFNTSTYLSGAFEPMQFMRDANLRAGEDRGIKLMTERLVGSRLLGVFCSPTTGYDRLDMRREMAHLRSMLGDTNRFTGDIIHQAVKADVVERLGSGAYQICHFSGHGVVDPETRRGALVLCDFGGRPEYLWVDELMELRSRGGVLPKLFVLSACQTAHTPFMGGFKDLARGLIEATSATVIAMQQPILDDSAIAFSRQFYRSLGEGYLVEDAVHASRAEMFRRKGSNRIDFATPVVYQERQIGLA